MQGPLRVPGCLVERVGVRTAGATAAAIHTRVAVDAGVGQLLVEKMAQQHQSLASVRWRLPLREDGERRQ